MSQTASRKSISATELREVGGVPLLLEIETREQPALQRAQEDSTAIQELLRRQGCVLIRGLKIHGSAQFGEILATLFGAPLIEYTYRSTPRTALRGNVYTATEYPAAELIPQHNENSYARHWPDRIGFLCLLPAESGGETPIGDSRLVYDKLPEPLRRKFIDKGILYVRNYSTLDLPWSVVFQTDDKATVERYCVANELTYEWLPDGSLRTRQVNPATAVHPVTGETIWFNQAHLFHVSALGTELADTLIESLGEDRLPRNTYYGDGSRIEPEALAVIREVYESTKIAFPWQRSDLLLLDNMRYTHGRQAYRGARKVLTGMACPNSHRGRGSD
jgi:alpha-ketoglutarate-dependent taurine dioxygenase